MHQHKFHIPVMGTGHSIDSPIRVAHLGIDSVISVVDDLLCEKIRKYYCGEFDLPYKNIPRSDPDGRSKRITAYLDMVFEITERKFEDLKSMSLFSDTEKERYFRLLPDSNPLKKKYVGLKERIGSLTEKELIKHAKELTQSMTPGSIDVNIMAKVDALRSDRNDKPMSREYSDANAALRGFANSKLTSNLVLSAGFNPRLYNYLSEFSDFYRDQKGRIKKKIILKVSDFRSALIQGKYLAKKGLEVAEFRIESGLNCGGHAFASDGYLLPVLLKEFREKHMEHDCFPDRFGFEWGLTFEQYLNLLNEKFPKPEDLKVCVIDPNATGDLKIPEDTDLIIIDTSGGAGSGEGKAGDQEKDKEEDTHGEGKKDGKDGDGKCKDIDDLDLPDGIPVVESHTWMDEGALEDARAAAKAASEGKMDTESKETQDPSREQDPTAHYGEQSFEPAVMEGSMTDLVYQVVSDYERRNGRGTLPGNLVEIIADILTVPPADIPWKVVLKKCISHAVPQEDDEIFSLPNRRLNHLRPQGVFPFPSYIQVTGMQIALIRDTSGSMGGPEIEEVISVALSFMKEFPTSKLFLVDADTKVHAVYEIDEKSDIPDSVTGRGGTDFIQPIAYTIENLKPDIILYGTDGYGTAPPSPPPVPVVWLMTYHSHVPAAYGTAIQISTGEILQR